VLMASVAFRVETRSNSIERSFPRDLTRFPRGLTRLISRFARLRMSFPRLSLFLQSINSQMMIPYHL
jgi:hypothetical protein